MADISTITLFASVIKFGFNVLKYRFIYIKQFQCVFSSMTFLILLSTVRVIGNSFIVVA